MANNNPTPDHQNNRDQNNLNQNHVDQSGSNQGGLNQNNLNKNNMYQRNQYKPNKNKTWVIYTILLCLLAGGLFSFNKFFIEDKQDIEVITREAVVSQIHSLSRLETVAYQIDTVITTRREGNWFILWLDEQKGLFVAHGKVVAGVDLKKLTPEHVQILPSPKPKQGESPQPSKVIITLPPAEIFSVYLDNIEVYDIRTGILGLSKTDSAMFNQAQVSGKEQVLKKACESKVLDMAGDNAVKQVTALFKLAQLDVTVKTSPPYPCMVNPTPA